MAPAPAADPQALPEPPADSGLMPPDENAREALDENAREALAKLLIAAMVTAAKADGIVDEEQQAMLRHSDALELTPEEQGMLFSEMAEPFDMEPVVAGANMSEIATEVYAASVVAVGTLSAAERAYLKILAQRLKLPDDVVSSLHTTLGFQAA